MRRREVRPERPARILDDDRAAAALWCDISIGGGALDRPELDVFDPTGRHRERLRAARLRRVVASLDTDRPDVRRLRPGGLDALRAALADDARGVS